MNLHDKAFRQLMKEPGAVRSLVMACLPKRLTRLIAGEPRAVSETYLEHPLRSAIADSVWELPLRGGATLTIFLVLEHKSRSDAKVAVQLGRYLIAVASWAAKGGHVPLTVALVVYTGKANWRGPWRYADAVDVPRALKGLGLDFPIHVLDVGRLALNELPRHPTLKGGLIALKTGSDPRALRTSVFEMLDSLRGDPLSRAFFVEYLLETTSAGEVRQALLDVLELYKFEKEPEMKSARDEINEWIADAAKVAARKAARKAARTAAKAAARNSAETVTRQKLRRVLDTRFKSLPADVDERLARADLALLDKWFDAALTARSARAVFAAS